jgi:hypothetical protein
VLFKDEMAPSLSLESKVPSGREMTAYFVEVIVGRSGDSSVPLKAAERERRRRREEVAALELRRCVEVVDIR